MDGFAATAETLRYGRACVIDPDGGNPAQSIGIYVGTEDERMLRVLRRRHGGRFANRRHRRVTQPGQLWAGALDSTELDPSIHAASPADVRGLVRVHQHDAHWWNPDRHEMPLQTLLCDRARSATLDVLDAPGALGCSGSGACSVSFTRARPGPPGPRGCS